MSGRILTFAALTALAAGCGRSEPKPVAVPVIAAIEPAKPAVAAAGPEEAPPPRPTPEPYRPPTDAAGRVVTAALAPAVPPSPPLSGAAPRPRTSAFDRGELPLPPVVATVPTLPPPPARPPRPSPPPEQVPADLGRLASDDPARVRMPQRPLAKSQAPSMLADLPPLARPLPDRAPLEDPTVEIVAARTVFTALPLPAPAAWFARFGVPDPFEFIEQMKGKTAVEKELGTAPVPVPPAR
jgi:hypothetical protein